jgi:hypothetical protein
MKAGFSALISVKMVRNGSLVKTLIRDKVGCFVKYLFRSYELKSYLAFY